MSYKTFFVPLLIISCTLSSGISYASSTSKLLESCKTAVEFKDNIEKADKDIKALSLSCLSYICFSRLCRTVS